MFTRENAAICARKSHEPTSARFVHPVEVDKEVQEADEFRRLQLATTRAQLKRLHKLTSEELDASKLDRLASATAKFSEIERQLAGRPMPGSLRPTSTKAKHESPKVE